MKNAFSSISTQDRIKIYLQNFAMTPVRKKGIQNSHQSPGRVTRQIFKIQSSKSKNT